MQSMIINAAAKPYATELKINFKDLFTSTPNKDKPTTEYLL